MEAFLVGGPKQHRKIEVLDFGFWMVLFLVLAMELREGGERLGLWDTEHDDYELDCDDFDDEGGFLRLEWLA